jgi:hypothetical protein
LGEVQRRDDEIYAEMRLNRRHGIDHIDPVVASIQRHRRGEALHHIDRRHNIDSIDPEG